MNVFDALVTKDYLDARLDQFRGEFNGKLHSIQVTQAIIVAGVAIPVIQSLMVWFN